jgi:hypothetical protein
MNSDAVVSQLSEKSSLKEGSIVYGLPRTVFNVVVDMERTIEVPGPYWKYAGDLLGLDNVIKARNEFWTIRNVSVLSAEELDPSQFYVIESNGVFESNVLSMKKEGLILDLNPSMYYSAGNKNISREGESTPFSTLDMGSDEYFQVQSDTAFRRVNLDSTFIRIPYIVEKRKQLPDEQLAERAAKRLMEMRDGKHQILTGESNVFPQSEAAINEMNRMENEYLELFTGKTLKERKTFTFQIIPSSQNAGKQVKLFQFSEFAGPVEDQATGEPVMVELTPERKTKVLSSLNSQLTGGSGKHAENKLYYRIPDIANLKITIGNEVLFNSRRLVYQLGEIVQLPSGLILAR